MVILWFSKTFVKLEYEGTFQKALSNKICNIFIYVKKYYVAYAFCNQSPCGV